MADEGEGFRPYFASPASDKVVVRGSEGSEWLFLAAGRAEREMRFPSTYEWSC